MTGVNNVPDQVKQSTPCWVPWSLLWAQVWTPAWVQASLLWEGAVASPVWPLASSPLFVLACPPSSPPSALTCTYADTLVT